jgi:hypothetical protein|tara:strand:+ start:168 stop:425 length:258 start_codon:yes stop_codon:yes gene_type:complete
MCVGSLLKMIKYIAKGETMKITKSNFEAYEEVRRYGGWNMFDPMARLSSGLNKDKYLAIIENYDTLKTKFQEKKETTPWDLTSTD